MEGYFMSKFKLLSVLLMSASCFAGHNDVSIYDELLNDQEPVNASEDTIFVSADQVEDLFEETNRARLHVKHHKIWFVNNLNPLPGNGSYKNPFSTLLAAQNASKKGDI